MNLFNRFKREASNNTDISNFTSEWDEGKNIHTGKFEFNDKKFRFILNEGNKISALSISLLAKISRPEGQDELSLHKIANSINDLMISVKFVIDNIDDDNIYLSVRTELVSIEIKDLSPVFFMLKILATAPAFFFNLPKED